MDIGESSLDMVQVPSFCKARKVLFLLQESAASASSPGGLERSSNVSRFVASFDQRGFDQQDGCALRQLRISEIVVLI